MTRYNQVTYFNSLACLSHFVKGPRNKIFIVSNYERELVSQPTTNFTPVFTTAAGCNYNFYVLMFMRISIFMSKSEMSAQSQQHFFHRLVYKILKEFWHFCDNHFLHNWIEIAKYMVWNYSVMLQGVNINSGASISCNLKFNVFSLSFSSGFLL